MIQTLEWTDAGVRFIDQTKLPTEEVYVTCKTHEQVADVIRNMVVRGAPAIGVAAAMGIALGVNNSKAESTGDLKRDLDQICDLIGKTRPTAVNLFWAIRRMQEKFERIRIRPIPQIKRDLIEEAQRMHAEDIAANQAMGRHGATLMPSAGGVLTHCNAGALATAGYGTALGVIRAAVAQGKKIHVYADETRPFLQGSRLTAWELMKDGIPTTVISDNMAGAMMSQGKIGAIVVGADRIAANGDVANKIGTYTVAILAKEHGIPFYRCSRPARSRAQSYTEFGRLQRVIEALVALAALALGAKPVFEGLVALLQAAVRDHVLGRHLAAGIEFDAGIAEAVESGRAGEPIWIPVRRMRSRVSRNDLITSKIRRTPSW